MKKMLFLAAMLSVGLAQAADLVGVYREAVGYDAQIASARFALTAGREQLPQARAGLLPTLGLSANTTWNDLDTYIRSEPPTNQGLSYNSNGWALTLSQPLFRWQNWVTYQQAGLLVAQAETQYGLARQDLITRVAQAYFDVLLAQETLASVKSQEAAITEQLAAAKRNFEVGTATITDTHEAQARYDLSRAQEVTAQNDLAVKRDILQTIIGKPPGDLKKLNPKALIGPPQPNDILQWVSAAEQNSLSVQFSQAAFEVAQREIERQRAGHLPTLDLVATRGRSSQTGALSLGIPRPGSDTESTVIGLQLALPLYAGGATISRDRQAVALREKARSDLDNVRRNASLAARQAFLGVTSGLAQVKALEQGLVSSESALESNKLGYEVGVRINIDVLNAQQQVFSTRRDLAKARLDTLSAQLRLKAAVGSLSEADLVAINALLQ